MLSLRRVAAIMAQSELEDADAAAQGDPYVPGLTALRQLLGLLMDARKAYGYDLNQLARANGRPLVT